MTNEMRKIGATITVLEFLIGAGKTNGGYKSSEGRWVSIPKDKIAEYEGRLYAAKEEYACLEIDDENKWVF